ncbi:MAG: family 2 glycosyl transferase [Verrucomicrobia bacterium]|nr:MAG: family 2 glycosyl transferase [Verrucomicrobiota bacterium]
MQLSVIICSHNPRMDYLVRVLQALKEQDLSCFEWELLLIDNASRIPLAGTCDLSWHPHARSVVETEVGLTSARLRAIREARSEILVFVDDDNVLEHDYLLECTRISENYRYLGAWGGQELHEFEGGEPQEKWKRDFWMPPRLEKEIWSNNYDRAAAPAGAGMCIRRVVAMKYAECVTPGSLRSSLGRSGRGMNSSEDFDMAFTACDMGLGIGRFPSLRLVHLIPRQRLTDDYLFRLIKGISYSETVLIALRQGIPAKQCRIDRLVDFYKRLRMPKLQRSIARAVADGRMRALNDLVDLRNVSAP